MPQPVFACQQRQQPSRSPPSPCSATLTSATRHWCRTLCLAGRRLAALDAPLQALLSSSGNEPALMAAQQQVFLACGLTVTCSKLAWVCRLQREHLQQLCRCSQLLLGSWRVALQQASSLPPTECGDLLVMSACAMRGIVQVAGALVAPSAPLLEQSLPPAELLPWLRAVADVARLQPQGVLAVQHDCVCLSWWLSSLAVFPAGCRIQQWLTPEACHLPQPLQAATGLKRWRTLRLCAT